MRNFLIGVAVGIIIAIIAFRAWIACSLHFHA